MSAEERYDIQKILQDMRAEYWQGLEEEVVEQADSSNEMLLFHAGPQRFALDARHCREIIKVPKIIRVPRLPSHFRGIINLRGEILAVTDLRPLFDLPNEEPGATARLVVVENAGRKTAILATAVDGLEPIATDAIEEVARGVGENKREFLSGKVVLPEGIMLVLNVGGLLGSSTMNVAQKEEQSLG
ncbi:MAG: chemotaxis protein CheW [Desulfuromonas sp.]|nr:MAG: chemotaxis protein CheW [Desulfuromonas sp.]